MRIYQSNLLYVIAGLLLVILQSAWAVTAKPNVIFVLTDDQGYGDLSCHGNPILKTPNLDRMHDQSVRFTDFHVRPLCTPTRGALLTGRDPGRNGAYRTSAGRTMLHRDEKTSANLFADNGYVTGMFGKWHLGDHVPHRPQDHGFQYVVWHRCGGIGQVSDYWGNDYFDDTCERNGKLETFKGYCTDVWFEEAIRFIEEKKEKPFFLYLPLNAPHSPYRVDPTWSAPYEEKASWNPGAKFYGMIANLDYNFGVLRERLEDLKLADNTVLIFMTDNGTAAGGKFDGFDSEALEGFNAGMRGKKASTVRAKVQIAGIERDCAVKPGNTGVVFEINLPAGPSELLTFLYDENGKAGGAYFTEVQAQ